MPKMQVARKGSGEVANIDELYSKLKMLVTLNTDIDGNILQAIIDVLQAFKDLKQEGKLDINVMMNIVVHAKNENIRNILISYLKLLQ